MNRQQFLFSALAVLGATAAASAQISFQPSVPIPVGTNPDASAIGDFNNDSRLDLAVASDAPDKVQILINLGNATFAAPVNVLTGGGTSPHTPVAGDLDGDGDVDIAVSLKNVGAVRILINNGGAFSLGPIFTVGAEPRTMAIGDLDGDGDRDLAVSNNTGNSASVLLNQGSLAFTVTTYPAGGDPRELDIGDVTGDGRADIAVAAHDDRAVRVLINLGSGAFSSNTSLSLGQLRPQGIAIANFNGTGAADIAASADNNDVQFASVLMSQGNGSFAGPVNYPLVGLDASSLAAADFDLDGDFDLASANTDSNDVSVIANAGNGTFGAAQLFAVGQQPGHVVAGDLDQNGSPELVTTNDASSNLSLLRNDADGCSTATYCVGKPNSQGGVASIGSTGTPSTATQDFHVTVSNALPGKPGLVFFSNTGPANLPFNGGTLCTAPPIVRLPVQNVSAAGTVDYAIAVTPAMVGSSRFYQFWHRDQLHPDGTGVALSNALAVTFCD